MKMGSWMGEDNIHSTNRPQHTIRRYPYTTPQTQTNQTTTFFQNCGHIFIKMSSCHKKSHPLILRHPAFHLRHGVKDLAVITRNVRAVPSTGQRNLFPSFRLQQIFHPAELDGAPNQVVAEPVTRGVPQAWSNVVRGSWCWTTST